MGERDLDDTWVAAFAAFDGNDVPIDAGFGHLMADLPHARLLELRRRRTAEAAAEAREVLGDRRSPWLLEAFVAGVLERAGDHGAALSTRLALLPDVPRWEGLLASHVLTAIARDALALGRPARAIEAARRALRFSPLEPSTLAILAAALQASGAETDAASVRAHLWDANYGPDVLAGSPSDADRAATAWTPGLGDLEPMSLEDRARWAVYSLNDPTHLMIVTGLIRHALIQLRSGDYAQARATLYEHRTWQPNSCEITRWLGLEGDSDRRDRMRALLLDALDATPAGAAAASADRKRAPNPASSGYLGRIRGVREAPLDAVAPALLDFCMGIRLAARRRLPDHPLVVRAAALEESVEGLARLYGADPPAVDPGVQNIVGGIGALPGITVADQLAEPPDALNGAKITQIIEPARAARPVCKACKQPFVVGAPQLRVCGEYDALAKATPYHPRCAAKGKPRKALEAAAARWRHPLDRGDGT